MCDTLNIKDLNEICPICESNDLIAYPYLCLNCKNGFDKPTTKREKWDKRFLSLAKHISTWSRDPSTRVGSVVVDKDKRILSTGYNGFARKVKDSKERYKDRKIKYGMILHGEMNAFLFANQSLEGCTLYTWPFASCPSCASAAIQKGIARCVFPKLSKNIPDWIANKTEEQIEQDYLRWSKELELTKQIFEEVGMERTEYAIEEIL